MTHPAAVVFLSGGLAMLAGCGAQSSPPVEALAGTENVSALGLRAIKGTRDGEHLAVHAAFGEGTRGIQLELRINVTPPARLESGRWSGFGQQGAVRQRSVTFLGGQSGAPSLGGRFDLLDTDESAQYRVTIPLQELRQPL
jgi:hypothetical protein